MAVFPNPATCKATLLYYLPMASAVRVEENDAVVRTVVSLAADERQLLARTHTRAVPTLAPELYTVQLRHEGIAAYRKLVIE